MRCKCEDLHVFDLSGNSGDGNMIVALTAASYSTCSEARLPSCYEKLKRDNHALNGATMVPWVITTFGKLGASAEGYIQNLSTVACSTGVAGRGMQLALC